MNSKCVAILCAAPFYRNTEVFPKAQTESLTLKRNKKQRAARVTHFFNSALATVKNENIANQSRIQQFLKAEYGAEKHLLV